MLETNHYKNKDFFMFKADSIRSGCFALKG